MFADCFALAFPELVSRVSKKMFLYCNLIGSFKKVVSVRPRSFYTLFWVRISKICWLFIGHKIFSTSGLDSTSFRVSKDFFPPFFLLFDLVSTYSESTESITCTKPCLINLDASLSEIFLNHERHLFRNLVLQICTPSGISRTSASRS